MRLARFKYTGILAVVLEYAVIGYLISVTGQPLDMTLTISDIGALDGARLAFALAFSTAAILFTLFGLWLSSEYRIDRNFKVALVAGALAQISFSWLPASGNTRQLHDALALVVMVLMPVLIYYAWLKLNDITTKRWSAIFIGCQLVSLALIVPSRIFSIPLLPEVITGVAWQAWVVLVTLRHQSLAERHSS